VLEGRILKGEAVNNPAGSDGSGSKRWGVLVGLLLLGVVLGGFIGGGIGGVIGAHQSDADEAAGACYLEGCAFTAIGYAVYGLFLGAMFGAILGVLVWVRARRKPSPP
jgi:hypothetical protein